MKRSFVAIFLFVTAVAIAIASRALATERPVTIANVKTGNAVLRQEGRLTVLELKPQAGVKQRIALTHPSDYRQAAYPPYEAKLIVEDPGRFLVFTDRFASNPANVQGHCGASDGERFLHVVSLDTIPHETLSVLIESCLGDLEPTSRSPEWIAKPDSAGFIGKLVITFESDTSPSLTYWVAPDGSVTRPEKKPAASGR